MKNNEKKVIKAEEVKPEENGTKLTDEQLENVAGGNIPNVVFEKPEEIDSSDFKFPICY